jgi:hypothetical protein
VTFVVNQISAQHSKDASSREQNENSDKTIPRKYKYKRSDNELPHITSMNKRYVSINLRALNHLVRAQKDIVRYQETKQDLTM